MMGARIATSREDATHRFPTEVLWGNGYFGDGMRYLSATSDAAALAHPRAISAATELMHLQRYMPNGKWRNCQDLAREAQQIMADIAEQPGVQRLLDAAPDPLFIGVFPTGISYADRTRERHGDYVRLAFLPYSTLVLQVERDCPAGLRARIEADARRMEMLRGQDYPVSSCGQTVRLGG